MAVTITKEPALCSPCDGNKVEFELSSDNMYSAAGTKALQLLYPSGAPVADEHFTLSWGVQTVTFTCKASPDDSGTQFRTKGAESLAEWLNNSFLYALNSNYSLTTDFNITIDGTKISLEAKEYGTAYTLILSANTFANMTEFSNTPGVDRVANANFGILVQIFSGTTLLSEEIISCDSSGNSKIDVSEILLSELSSDFEFPEADANNMLYQNTHSLAYFIKYAEIYDGITRELHSTDVFYAFNGGLSFYLENKNIVNNQTFLQYFDLGKKFLTWSPIIKTTDVTSVEKLYFLNTNISSFFNYIKLYVALTYTDGTSSGYVLKGSIVNSNYSLYKIIEIETGYDKLDLATTAGSKTVKYYKVKLQINGNDVSQIFTYLMDYNYYPNCRYFIFKNSLGAYEPIRFTGIREDTDEFSRTEIEPAFITNTLKARKINSINIKNRDNFKHNSGWLTKEELDWSTELLLSEDVYEIVGNNLFPVIITSTKTNKRKDNNFQYNREIEYSYAYINKKYSSEPKVVIGGSFSDGFSDGFDNTEPVG